MINRLLNRKEINVNLQNKRGDTALILASKCGHLDITKLLKEIHETQIREGFELANKDGRKFNTLYIYTDIVELVIDFTV